MLTLERAGRPLIFPTRRARTLFAYLILHRGRPRSREAVRSTFWRDEPDTAARKHLRNELWRLRRQFEPRGVPRGTYLQIGDDEIQFNTAGGPYWLDVDEFERQIRASGVGPAEPLTPERARRLEEAVALYRGDLFENIYEDWTQPERERLKRLLCGALEHLMAHHSAHRNWDLAIGWGHRLLVCDPFQEHVHRELMRAHHAKGDRPAALHQFDLCADFLRRELGVVPMPETVTLYQAMRKGDWSGREIAIPDRRPRPVADTLDRGLRPLGRGVVSDRGK